MTDVVRCVIRTAIFPVAGLGSRFLPETQLADAIAELLTEEPVFAFHFEGRRFDCGSKLGYLAATVNFGLKHPEVGARVWRAAFPT